ncbi:MAG TPA: response regulator, partial [Polyangiales bacterium]
MGDSSGSKKQLGKIMLQQKLVTQDELTGILEEQERRGGKLASTAAREGKITITDALRALSEQHGVPAIDLRRQIIPLVNLQLVPVEIAREHAVLPVKVQGEQLLLAMATPQNETSIEEIRFVTAKVVFPHVALDEPLHQAIDEAYALLERGEKYFVGEYVTDEELLALGIARPSPPPVSIEPPPPSAAGRIAPAPGDTVLGGPVEAAVTGVVHARSPGGGPELDQAFSEPPQASRSGPPLPNFHGKKVLIVEDDDDTRRLIRLTLEHAGMHCLEADSGTRALEMIRDESPDAIVLDAVLPGVHGFDICRRLRGSQRYGAIPIVVVSAIHHGWRVAEDLRSAYNVQHVFDKPIDLVKFTRTVGLLLEGKEVAHDDIALSEGAEAELKR